MTRSYPRGRWQIWPIAVLIVLASAGTARASTVITVNTTSDAGTPNPSECSGVAGDCSLRQAGDKAASGDMIVVPANASAYALTQGQITLGNNATSTDGSTAGGGGIYVDLTTLNVTNSTISGNSATGNSAAEGSQGHGGGIYSAAEVDVHLTSATLASNGASGASGSSGGN